MKGSSAATDRSFGATPTGDRCADTRTARWGVTDVTD